MNLGFRVRQLGADISKWTKTHPVKTALILVILLLVEQIVTLPYGAVNQLRKKNPSTTAFMEERTDLARKEGRQTKRSQIWIPLKEIPRVVINAVIVSEDGMFWSHHGFDWYEFKESIERNLEEGRAARGASTLTQQLVKNLYLSTSKNPLRKLKEWILTWWMETRLTKSRILEIYLNVIEWGDGVYGVEAASRYHFGKSVVLLDRTEAARMAAIIPSPRGYMAGSESPYVVRRSELILQRLQARGL
jgi:monofunctional biosynthetic peptidoglycan transglycosylase